MSGVETEEDLSTARSTSAVDDDFTILPNGLVVTRIVQVTVIVYRQLTFFPQIWPTRSREAPTGTDIRMWMGEVRVDGARIEDSCYVKLRVLCKARWRPFWTCRNAHSTIEPRGVRYIQFEFPEPAMDHLQLNLIAGEHEVKILLERMPGTETFLWRDTADLRRILLARVAALKEQRKITLRESLSDLSTAIESDLETAYSPTPLSDEDETSERSKIDTSGLMTTPPSEYR
ncbi:hypothetical protein PMAYCL1PPCAC_21874 [Pristionchus mayeri]|uniref:Uncharacterized protein n=1 Tax=Pristionchus mayeri TaxID=1317129 RepID=A0AAN5CW38_9BILA|nr:hypothetical protein PMAYCL1PPCAC_21874 [Pristionchus mayeri]